MRGLPLGDWKKCVWMWEFGEKHGYDGIQFRNSTTLGRTHCRHGSGSRTFTALRIADDPRGKQSAAYLLWSHVNMQRPLAALLALSWPSDGKVTDATKPHTSFSQGSPSICSVGRLRRSLVEHMTFVTVSWCWDFRVVPGFQRVGQTADQHILHSSCDTEEFYSVRFGLSGLSFPSSLQPLTYCSRRGRRCKWITHYTSNSVAAWWSIGEGFLNLSKTFLRWDVLTFFPDEISDAA